jgi:acetyl/propionyl-CoA carboxylase alpha subunit
VSNQPDDSIEVIRLGHGLYQVINGANRRIAYAVVGRDAWVFLDGRVYVVSDPSHRSPRRSSADGEHALTAPMPATVLAINVTPGQQVERNDVVMVLEAMKMELPLRSPRDGIVKTIACQVGELVQPGTKLLEIL